MPLTSHGRKAPFPRDRANASDASRGRALTIDEIAARRAADLARRERARATMLAASDPEAAKAANDNADAADRIVALIKAGH